MILNYADPLDKHKVTDSPSWRHRGLMVDTARRFLPPALLRTIIDGMSFSKLNVLHLHLSDEPVMCGEVGE